MLVGLALIGIALANILPIVYSAAGRTADHSGSSAIAAATTTGYLGYFGGPPAIGITADYISLRGGLATVVALGLIMLAIDTAVRPTPVAPAEPAASLQRVQPAPVPVRAGQPHCSYQVRCSRRRRASDRFDPADIGPVRDSRTNCERHQMPDGARRPLIRPVHQTVASCYRQDRIHAPKACSTLERSGQAMRERYFAALGA